MKTNKGTIGSSESEKEFLNKFHQLCYRNHAWQVWKDFVTMSACAIANAVDHRPDVQKQREDLYMETIKRYSKEDLELLCELLGVTVLALDENPAQDFLGSLYMKLDFGSDWHGQFFTPWHVAELMARIQAGEELSKQIESEGYIFVNDSCCGAGCMLMAFADVCKNHMDINFQQSVIFVGQDVDSTVALMCYIQISLLGCPGYVVVGNSLTELVHGHVLDPNFEKPEDIWFTPLYFTDIWTLRRIRLWNCTDKEETMQEPKNESKPEEPQIKVETPKHKPYPKPVIKKPEQRKKPFSWKDFFTVKGKDKK